MPRVLLVGTEAVGCHAAMEAAGLQLAGACASVGTIMEAILKSDPDLSASAGHRLIIVSAGDESDHLQQALRGLREVNPQACIILLCEPEDEPLCRRARAWGADDYYILPLDLPSMRRIAAADRPHGAAVMHSAAQSRDAGTPQSPGRTLTDVPLLPLSIQAELLEELLDGAGARPDFAERAVAALRHLPAGGRWRFVPADAGPGSVDGKSQDTGELRQIVALPDQPPLGTLILQLNGMVPKADDALTVAQAARWLAGVLGLARQHRQLRQLAITDELSGAYNRRYFMKFMAGALQRARENRTRVTLLLFDIDDFKKYNDTYGHASGDAIIRELIRLLRACTRPYDLVARIGGDEFAVVYRDNEAPRQPNSEHPREIIAATERFREAIGNHQWFETCRVEGTISISGGLATFPWDADTVELLMAKADETMLKAKAGGKNVILLHGAPTPAASSPPRVAPTL